MTTRNDAGSVQVAYARGHVLMPAAGLADLGDDVKRAARRISVRQRPYVAIPHTPSHALTMRAAGLSVDVPLEIPRDFPLIKGGRRRDPFEHQVETTRFLIEHPRAFVLNEAGLGKTASAIWAWYYLHRAGKAGRLVVFCPKTIMVSAWQLDLMATVMNVSAAVVTGAARKRAKIIDGPAAVLIVNHDGVLHNKLALSRASGITHVIIDEAAAYNRYNSQRAKAMRAYVRGKSCWCMTATPISHSPDRAWALAQLVDPGNACPSYFEFRALVMRKPYRSAMNWVPREREVWEPIVSRALSPAIRFTKSDCLDLPPQLVAPDRVVDLTPEQRQFADAMIKDWVYEDTAGQSGPVSAVNAAARLTKLLQCYQGAVRRDDGTVLELPYGPRFDAVTEIIDEAEGKIIVFAQFVAPLQRLVRELTARYGSGSTAGIYGATTQAARAATVRDFQDPTSPLRILVAHPETASHGLTLTEANVIIWFGPYFKAENYAQANERMNRPGQTRSMTVHHLVADALESDVFAGLQARLQTQDIVLAAYRSRIRA